MRRVGQWLVTASLMLATTPAMAQHKAVDLPGARAFPENLDIAPDGTAYVGSLSGGVRKVDLKTGAMTQWIAPGAFGTSSTFGILIDTANDLLWVCNNNLAAAPQGADIPGADSGATLKGFDLASGAGKVSLPFPTDNGFCNDIAVGPDGTVYVTDTNRSHILRWTPGADALEDWYYNLALAAPAHDLSGLDGIAFGADGHLYLNNWRTNILARLTVTADGMAGALTMLETSRPLDVPDGLRPLGGLRFALAEGSGKVALISIAGDRAQVTTLAENLGQTTGVAPYGGMIWHVEGEASYVFNPGLRNKAPPLPFRISPVTLP